ncbi:N-carbamoylsarcosine amidohydrolase [Photobacterium minamisatsumaniensis]|uniref:N-carbamoylsarcosine amidohydrolase n=1 Tax=Photobacterium minamisatsumaniensis TaxID=2910233 RepID=UPI003D0BD0FE
MSDIKSNNDVLNNYQGVWDTKIGFGAKSALLLVDFMKAYTTPNSLLYAPDVVNAVAKTESVLKQARKTGEMVIHTNIRYHSPSFADGGTWVKKAPVMREMVEGNILAEFCPGVIPQTNELVITKQYASAFFGTTLASTLTASGIDTVVIAGCSTSGCVRATAVDAMQHGFRVIVLEDCVGDRHKSPHDANLFDINSKYGDVISSADYLQYIGVVDTVSA